MEFAMECNECVFQFQANLSFRTLSKGKKIVSPHLQLCDDNVENIWCLFCLIISYQLYKIVMLSFHNKLLLFVSDRRTLFKLTVLSTCYFATQAAGVAGAAAAGAVALQTAVFARELELHPPSFPWSHLGVFDSFDHARYAVSCLALFI